jgi:dipeptidyl aminopeptidase/acylaminoacyl peptidase
MRTRFLLLSALAFPSVMFGAEPPQAAAPEIFSPGVISGPANDGAPTFSPDGTTLYFTRSGPNGIESIIMESHWSSGNWSRPTVAPFSGEWYDSSPTWAPDGSCMIFESNRPPVGKATPHDSHLWQVDRHADGWGKPEELSSAVNLGPLIYRPSLAADGTLYFISRATADKKFQLYRSTVVKGLFQPAQALAFSDGTFFDVDPEVSHDQSFLIFGSVGRPPYKDAAEHLFLVRRNGDSWGPPLPIRYEGDTWAGATFDDDPRLGPDQATIYFSSDRSPPVHYPLNPDGVKADLARMGTWDNGSANVWILRLPKGLASG